MIIQGELWQKPVLEADIVYTQREVARNIIRFLNPAGTCLDPCKGDGAFYDYLPWMPFSPILKQRGSVHSRVEAISTPEIRLKVGWCEIIKIMPGLKG